MEIIDKYISDLYISEEINHLLEINFKSLIDKFKTNSDAISFGKKLKTVVDPKNAEKTISKVKDLTKHINIDLSSVDNFLSKNDKDFIKRKNLAGQILKNSLSQASPKSIDVASTFLSFSSVIQKKDNQVPPNKKLKTDIKQFVERVRKFEMDQDNDENKSKRGQIAMDSVPDYAIGLIVIISVAVLVWGLLSFTTIMITGIFTAIGSFGSFLLSPMGLGLVLLFAIMSVVAKNQAPS